MAEYTSTAARVTAERNVYVADVMETANKHCVTLTAMREDLNEQYWELHKALSVCNFDCTEYQDEAAAKLGEFAIAIKKLNEAYTTFNRVRCLG